MTKRNTKKTIMCCCADLVEAFIQVGQGAGNDASVTVTLSPSCDGKGLPTARLAIGKNGTIKASQYTARHTRRNTDLTLVCG